MNPLCNFVQKVDLDIPSYNFYVFFLEIESPIKTPGERILN